MKIRVKIPISTLVRKTWWRHLCLQTVVLRVTDNWRQGIQRLPERVHTKRQSVSRRDSRDEWLFWCYCRVYKNHGKRPRSKYHQGTVRRNCYQYLILSAVIGTTPAPSLQERTCSKRQHMQLECWAHAIGELLKNPNILCVKLNTSILDIGLSKKSRTLAQHFFGKNDSLVNSLPSAVNLNTWQSLACLLWHSKVTCVSHQLHYC